MSGKFWYWAIVLAILCGVIGGKVLSIKYLPRAVDSASKENIYTYKKASSFSLA